MSMITYIIDIMQQPPEQGKYGDKFLKGPVWGQTWGGGGASTPCEQTLPPPYPGYISDLSFTEYNGG